MSVLESKLDPGMSGRARLFAEQYGVQSLPTTGFFRADGGPKLGFVGAAEPQDMVKIMKTSYDKLEKSKSEKK